MTCLSPPRSSEPNARAWYVSNMKDPVERARLLLTMTHQTPRMYASCREAMVAHICGIVHVVKDDFDPYEFYKRHLGTNGSCYVAPDGPVDDTWARVAIDDALQALGGKKRTSSRATSSPPK